MFDCEPEIFKTSDDDHGEGFRGMFKEARLSVCVSEE